MKYVINLMERLLDTSHNPVIIILQEKMNIAHECGVILAARKW